MIAPTFSVRLGQSSVKALGLLLHAGAAPGAGDAGGGRLYDYVDDGGLAAVEGAFERGVESRWGSSTVSPRGRRVPRAMPSKLVKPSSRPGLRRSGVRAVQPALLEMTVTTGMLWRTQVSSSIAFMPIEPSPCSTSTCLSGLASLAPMPLGQAYAHGAGYRRSSGGGPGTWVLMDWRPKCRISLPSTETMASRSRKLLISLHRRSG